MRPLGITLQVMLRRRVVVQQYGDSRRIFRWCCYPCCSSCLVIRHGPGMEEALENMGIGDGSDRIERRSGHTTERQRSRRSKTNERAQGGTQEPRTPAANAGLLPYACPGFLPTAAQPTCNYLNFFSDLYIYNDFKY